MWGNVHKHTWSSRYQVGLTHSVMEYSWTKVPGQGTAWCSPQGTGRISSLWQSPDPSPESRWMSMSRKHWNSKVTWWLTPSQPIWLYAETEQAGFNFSNKHEHGSSHLVFWEPMKSAVRSYTHSKSNHHKYLLWSSTFVSHTLSDDLSVNSYVDAIGQSLLFETKLFHYNWFQSLVQHE